MGRRKNKQIKSNTMKNPVNIKISKALKEKGFDERTPSVWICALGESRLREIDLSLELTDNEYNAPTIADVIMWLYEKHEMWIHVCYMVDTKNWWWDCYKYKKENGLLNPPGFSNGFNHQSPMEAYETAIFHILAFDLLSY
jgi:hypothetical protein